jgi:hypothetical protein
MEKRSPCFDCQIVENRKRCAIKCPLLKEYREWLDKTDDGITRGSTLSGVKYTILIED